jgi:uncharacterized protein YcgL (UPF0745 family)
MISSKKHQLLFALILACICAPVLGQEPNETKTELKFEVSSEEHKGVIGAGGKVVHPPGKPTHVAVLSITNKRRFPHPFDPNWIKSILDTSAAQLMSQQQREFPLLGHWITCTQQLGGSISLREPVVFYLYAVSQDDAKKTAEALIEALTSRANARMKELTNRQQELQEKIPKVKKKFEEKLTGLQTTWDKLREKFNGGPHSLKDYNEPVLRLEAVNEAKETIKEMYKKLDALKVEIEGIKAKLLAIEEYKAKKNVGTNILAKLEQILCEQTIELAGASARKKTTLEILMREEEFYNLNKKCEKAAHEANKFKGELSSYEHRLRDTKEKLSNPTPDMLPPNVYQNKVTIYPVRAGE